VGGMVLVGGGVLPSTTAQTLAATAVAAVRLHLLHLLLIAGGLHDTCNVHTGAADITFWKDAVINCVRSQRSTLGAGSPSHSACWTCSSGLGTRRSTCRSAPHSAAHVVLFA
jgi:hypothetical protein